MDGFFDPDLYTTANWTEAYGGWADDLAEHVPYMNWKENETILDIGCGDGDVIINQLLPSLPTSCSDNGLPIHYDVIGVDNSTQMIEYANKHYGKDDIKFSVMDITQVSL